MVPSAVAEEASSDDLYSPFVIELQLIFVTNDDVSAGSVIPNARRRDSLIIQSKINIFNAEEVDTFPGASTLLNASAF